MKETLDKVFSNVNQWLHFAEAKNAVLATLNGGAAIGLLGVLNADKPALSNYLTPLCLLMVALGVSIVLSLASFSPALTRPRTKSRRVEQPNLIFFGHIASFTPREYLEILYKTYAKQDLDFDSAQKCEQDLSEQIVTNAQIAVSKYVFFRIALWVDIVGLLASLVSATIIVFCVLG